MRLLFKASIVLIFLLVGQAYAWNPGRVVQIAIEEYRSDGVVVLGDSITQRAPWDAGVDNFGCGGHTVNDAIRMFELVVSRQPRVLALWLGTNNALKKPKAFYDDYEKLLGKVYARLPQTKIIIIGMTPLAAGYADRNVREFNAWLRDLSELNGIPFIDTYSLITVNQLVDGIHPNAEAYEVLLSYICGAIEVERGGEGR